MMLHCSNVAHAHLLHPVQARDLINQLAKKLITLLAISPVRRVKARHHKQELHVVQSHASVHTVHILVVTAALA